MRIVQHADRGQDTIYVEVQPDIRVHKTHVLREGECFVDVDIMGRIIGAEVLASGPDETYKWWRVLFCLEEAERVYNVWGMADLAKRTLPAFRRRE